MSRILFLSDLDHTLFQSHRLDKTGDHPMTRKRDGSSHCFANRAQKALLDMMMTNAFCMAVTARNIDQMRRVCGWDTQQKHDLALTNLGMTLMYRCENGEWEIVESWSDPYLLEARKRAKTVTGDANTYISLLEKYEKGWEMKLVYCDQDESVPYYVEFVQKDKDQRPLNPDAVREEASCLQGSYLVNIDDNKISLWPTYVSKKTAVKRLLSLLECGSEDPRLNAVTEEIGDVDLVLSAGDSVSDLGFMQVADFMLVPRQSQIFKLIR